MSTAESEFAEALAKLVLALMEFVMNVVGYVSVYIVVSDRYDSALAWAVMALMGGTNIMYEHFIRGDS